MMAAGAGPIKAASVGARMAAGAGSRMAGVGARMAAGAGYSMAGVRSSEIRGTADRHLLYAQDRLAEFPLQELTRGEYASLASQVQMPHCAFPYQKGSGLLLLRYEWLYKSEVRLVLKVKV